MKKLIFIFILLPYLGISQNRNLTANYNSVASGKNFSLIYSKMNEKENEYGIGVRYHLNSLKHPDDQFNVYYRRLYATKPLQHFGVEAFYHKRILKEWKTVKPFMFFNFQFSYSTTRNRSFLPYAQEFNGEIVHGDVIYNNSTTLYKEYIDFFGPYSWLEPTIGFGYNAELKNNFYITSKLGFEVMLVYGRDNDRTTKSLFQREFGYLFNFGIGYHFKTKKK